MSRWLCVICGFPNPDITVSREGMLCEKCLSNWRVRACAVGVQLALGRPPAPFPDFAADYSWRGIGTSDHMALVGALSMKFDYTNSYYHRYPRLDLLNIPDELQHHFGFVVCSDVLEHVPDPVDPALSGIADLLADHGFAILSVPTEGIGASTAEYYPNIATWKEFDDRVEWVDTSGEEHIDNNPEFHGGPGQTLVFRMWDAQDFCTRVQAAGFKRIVEIPPYPEFGVPEIENPGVFLAHVIR
jgi:SAM-dependent methyltransferase